MNHSIARIIDQIGHVVLGKERQIRYALTCLLAHGHLLIEDIPGVGKTTLAHALAQTLGLKFQRVQFTSDLLPADILGISIYEQNSGIFKFHPGPIFTHLILADEINRATPKTQSALLEAMEEHQVTVEGKTRSLPEPFFVIATQNPQQSIGTFPLPESQLDRFLMRIELGYPDHAAERTMLQGRNRHELIKEIQPCLDQETIAALFGTALNTHVSPALLDYLQALVGHTRQSPHFAMGLSPRASLALLHSAQAWAFIDGRDTVIPEDLQAILPAVVTHRLHPSANSDLASRKDLVNLLLDTVAIP